MIDYHRNIVGLKEYREKQGITTKTIGNMATPEFDFATDLKYGNSFKVS